MRPPEELEAELTHVRWLLGDLANWDNSLAPPTTRRVLREHFAAHERLLTDALTIEAPAGAPRKGEAPPVIEPVAAVEPVPVPQLVPEPIPVAEPVTQEARPSPPRAPKPPRPPRGPSAWERVWKPLLGESVGWFIGAFLILAGTFTFVTDAWGTMSDTGRSLTVFGLAMFWTMGFAGWAKMLERRDATRPASTVLWRIAAAVAPLATVALGPIITTSMLAWPLLLVQTVVAAVLSRKVVRDAWGTFDDERASLEAGALAVSMGLATIVLGAAPAMPRLGAWLELLPLIPAAIIWRRGPATAEGKLERFSILTTAYALALMMVRLHVAELGPGPWGVHAVAVAAFGAATLELRVRSARVADALSVLTVAVQVVVMVPAFFAPAPAFVIAALIATVTTARLALREEEDVAVRAARWLGGAYVFGYVAFQRIDQIVPQVMVEWYQRLKERLGYASAPLPPSYGSVYAAIFVLVVGVYAAVRLSRTSSAAVRARAGVLLTCTAWGALFFGALALVSLPTDPRPAVIALPALLLTTLVLGAWHDRVDLTRAGAALAVASGVAFAQAWGEAWPVALLALALAALSLVSWPKQREALSAATMLLVALAIGLSFLGEPRASQAMALVLAAAAGLLVARNLDDRTLLGLAAGLPLLLEVRFGAPWMLGVSALIAVSLPMKKGSRLEVLWPVAFVAALAGVGWEVERFNDWPTLTLALAAAALVVGARRMEQSTLARSLEALGLGCVLATLAPLSHRLPDYLPWHAQVLAALIALGGSIHALRKGRSWQGVLLVGGVVALALACAPSWTYGPWLAASVSLLATAALLPSVTVPLAAATVALVVYDEPVWLLGVATALSIAALFEEFDVTWKYVLNRARVGWAASLTAVAIIALSLAFTREEHVLLAAAATALLPLAWARATRQAWLLAIGLGLNAALGVMTHGPVVFVTPLLALVYSRGLLGFDVTATLLGTRRDVARWPLLAVSFIGALAAAASMHHPLALTSIWLGALVLLGGEGLAANLIAALVLSFVAPVTQLPFAGVMLVVALSLHHLETQTRRVLGASSAEFANAVASLGAVVLAGARSVTVGGANAQATLALALVVSGVLLGTWPLVSLAALAMSVDVPMTLREGWPALTQAALPVAIAFAALAVLLRQQRAAGVAEALWRRAGVDARVLPATPWWWGAAATVLLALFSPAVWWLVVPALLLFTPRRREASVAISLGAALLVLVLPRETAGMSLAVFGCVLVWSGVVYERTVAQAWFHAGWVLAVVAVVVVGFEPAHVAMPTVWGLGALTAWGVARRRPALEWAAWGATWLASHMLVGHLGLVFATGAPPELILPWFGMTTALIAGVALLLEGGQRRLVGLVLGWLAAVELVAALSVLSTPQVREAFVALAAGVLVAVTAARRSLKQDDGRSAWLAQGMLAVAVLAMRRLGAGAAPGVFEAWAAMTCGPILWGMSRFLAREQRFEVATSLRNGSVFWPLAGLLAAPWGEPRELVLLLLVHSAHYAWLARSGLRRAGASLAAVAFNAAMVAAFFATGWQGMQDLAVPLGLSVIALTYAFRDELGRDVQVKLRAVAMAAVYTAAAWRPLTFTTAWGLIFCVVVCLLGVAAGAALRVRSYVLLGTAFLVTSVLATLVRQGLAEPKLGAALLATLGVSVVAFMVLFTTRRAELLARVATLQKLMGSWEG